MTRVLRWGALAAAGVLAWRLLRRGRIPAPAVSAPPVEPVPNAPRPASPGARGPRPGRRVAVALALAILTGCGALAGQETWGAFSATTSAGSNGVATAGVTLGDNDAGGAVVVMSGARPGATSTGCIRVTSTGSADTTVSQFVTLTGTLAPYLNLKVTRGTETSPSFNSCSTFTADACNYTSNGAGVIYSGALSSFPTSAGTGIVDKSDTAGCATTESWTTSETHSYRYELTFPGTDVAAEGRAAGITMNWQGTNQ